MKNVFGNQITVTLFGESHQKSIGAVVDGLASGIKINEEYLYKKMLQRKATDDFSTSRCENDNVIFESGVFNGYTTGTPLCIRIENRDTKSKDYDKISTVARPNHGDYPAYVKYNGFNDYRGGGHISGRLTAPIVAVGAILEDALKQKGIFIGTHISYLGGFFDKNITENDLKFLDFAEFPTIDNNVGEQMKEKIRLVQKEKDSIGGILETLVAGVPAGVGEPWFDSVESVISHGVFSIPGIKGIEFGDGFSLAKMQGSQASDFYSVDNNKIVTKTNHMGGIGGGISNGQNIVFRCSVKPTPSIGKMQETVDFEKNENTVIEIIGRHDFSIIHRAKPVVDAMTAIAIADLLTVRFGTNYLSEKE